MLKVSSFLFCCSWNVGIGMLKREGLRSCSLHLRTLWSDHASAMALNKLFPSPSRGFSQMSVANEHGRLRRKHLVCMDIGSNNNLSMRGCSDRHDGVSRRADEDIQKAHVVGPHRHLVNGSKMVFSEDMGLSLVNGDGSCKHGKPLEFPGHLKSEKLAVAVDVDEGIYLKFKFLVLFLFIVCRLEVPLILVVLFRSSLILDLLCSRWSRLASFQLCNLLII